MTAGPSRVDTPHPAPPDLVVEALVGLAGPLGRFGRISIGFPGVVRNGRVLTAPNLGNTAWHDFPLAATLAERLGAPVRLANDATVQGLGEINGQGVECAITLGTGMGFALFEDGRPAPHLELSQHPVRGRKTYDKYIGNAALHAVGRKRWIRRVHTAIGFIDTLTDCDVLYVGGGNSRLLQGTYRRTSGLCRTRPASPAASGCGMRISTRCSWRSDVHRAACTAASSELRTATGRRASVPRGHRCSDRSRACAAIPRGRPAHCRYYPASRACRLARRLARPCRGSVRPRGFGGDADIGRGDPLGDPVVRRIRRASTMTI